MAVGVGRMTLPSVTMSGSGTVGSAFASTAAAFDAPERQAAVLALEPVYRELTDPILHVIVAGVEPAGPHLGNPDFTEEMLRELGRAEQDRRTTERLKEEANSARRWSLGEKLLLLVIGTVIGALLGKFGL